MRSAAVFKNSVFYTIASVLQGFIGFLLLPVYTKYLSPLDYGTLALVTSFVGILSSVITLQIHAGIPRFVVKFLKDENRAKSYFTGIFVLLAVILVLSCIVINIFGEQIVRIIFSDKNGISYAPFFQIGTWTLLPTLLISVSLLLLQVLEYGNKFLFVTMAQVTVNVFCGLYFVVSLKMGIMGVLWAQFIGAVFGLIFSISFLRGWFRFSLKKLPIRDIKASLVYSLPIIPHMLSIYIYMQSNRLILQRYVPLSDIGVYSIADTFASLSLFIINAANSAYNPVFLKLAEDDRKMAQEETRKFIEIWWVIILGIFMGYLVLSGNIIKLMTRPAFYPSIPLIPILAFAYIFRGLYCFSANSIFFTEKTKLIPVITVIAALVNVAGNIIFIPKFGVFAAAWVTFISYLVTFLLAYYFSALHFAIKYPWRSMIKTSIILLLVYATTKFLNSAFAMVFWVNFLINLVAVGAFLLFSVAVTYRIKNFALMKSFAVKIIKA